MLYALSMNEAYNSPYQRLSELSQTLYSELLALLMDDEASRVGTPPPGTIVEKTVRGRPYTYVQYSGAGKRRQVYLGPTGSEDVAKLVARARDAWSRATEEAAPRAKLVAMLSAEGAPLPSTGAATLLEMLARHHVFAAGGVLVGSLAYVALGWLLGIRWRHAYRTEDVDLAAESRVRVALAQRPDVPAALEATGMLFSAIPGLDPRAPSTSYKVRGQALRLDLLTPLRGRPVEGPVMVPAFGVVAHPLRYLDFLCESAVPAAVPWRDGILVRVPRPGHFALHKLLLATRRPPYEATKSHKDAVQAAAVVQALLDSRPWDLTEAWAALRQKPASWGEAVARGAELLPEGVRRRLLEARSS